MDYSELTAETIKLRIREELPSRETGLPGEILRLGKMRQDRIAELTARLKESEEDRAARLTQITELTALLKESEADRAARLEVMNRLQALLDQEKQRVTDLEERWRALERTFLVRLARRAGLISSRRHQRGGQTAGCD